MARALLKKVQLGAELLHPNDYVCALELKGKDATVTINKVVFEELRKIGQRGVEDEKERVPVLLFSETPKKLILNKTNASSIAVLYGTQASEWVGKRVTLYPTRVKCGRDTVDAIRVREVVPPAKGAAPSNDIGDIVSGATPNKEQE